MEVNSRPCVISLTALISHQLDLKEIGAEVLPKQLDKEVQ